MQVRVYNKKYDEAVSKYLRYGTPISEPNYLTRTVPKNIYHSSGCLIKSLPGNEMDYYIWRTQGDNRVRPTHEANNGKIFCYNYPPPTGHPGTEINCRCYAEDVHAKFDGIDDNVSTV